MAPSLIQAHLAMTNFFLEPLGLLRPASPSEHCVNVWYGISLTKLKVYRAVIFTTLLYACKYWIVRRDTKSSSVIVLPELPLQTSPYQMVAGQNSWNEGHRKGRLPQRSHPPTCPQNAWQLTVRSSFCIENSVSRASVRLVDGRISVSKIVLKSSTPQKPGHQFRYLGVAYPGPSNLA